jgi:hypothetical protein
VLRARLVPLLILCGAGALHAAEVAPEPKKLGWFNSTELSAVVTSGNSSARTYGFKDTVRGVWEVQRFRFKVDYVRADSADDRFLLVNPGYTFPPGGGLTDPAVTLVRPPIENDVEKMSVEATYARDIGKRTFWSLGAGWDRNEDAGIRNRYTGYATFGNRWWDQSDVRFATSYGVSYTDREETKPDPEKDREFAGVRLESDLFMSLGATASFENNITGNVNAGDPNDYAFQITNNLTAKMSKYFSLKVSLQWQFNHEPALQDADVIARVVLEDPDGIPGSGDEYFRTVSSGGMELTIGEDRVRKEQLDTIFRTTLVVDF